MTQTITTLDQFYDTYPAAEWLEDIGKYSRHSDGLEEGSQHESEWFDKNGKMLNGRPEEI